MADITTTDNAISTGRDRWLGWRQTWQKEYYKPLVTAVMKLWMQQQSPDVLANLDQMRPEAMAKLKERLNG